MVVQTVWVYVKTANAASKRRDGHVVEAFNDVPTFGASIVWCAGQKKRMEEAPVHLRETDPAHAGMPYHLNSVSVPPRVMCQTAEG